MGRPRKYDGEAKRLVLYVSIDEYQALVDLAIKGDVPMTTLIRRAIRSAIPSWQTALEANRLALL